MYIYIYTCFVCVADQMLRYVMRYVCVCVCVSRYIYICMYIYMYIYILYTVCVCLCVCVERCDAVCVCVFDMHTLCPEGCCFVCWKYYSAIFSFVCCVYVCFCVCVCALNICRYICVYTRTLILTHAHIRCTN